MQNSPHHDPVFVQRNFGTNLLFELCLFDCSARLDTVRSSGRWQEWCPFSVCRHMRAAFVCRMPQQTCCRHRLLRSPFVRVELPSSGAFVHGQPFLFLLALLSSPIWPTSRPGTQCATVALQGLQVLKCGGSSKILPLRIIVVSRRCNCTYHLARMCFQDEEKIRWKGDSKQVCSEAKTGSRSRLVFLVQVWSLCLCRWSGSREPVVEA